MSHMKLTVPKHVYERRLERMAESIALKAPPIIIYHEARLIMKACHPSPWYRIRHWFDCSRLGLWLDPEWRRFQRTGVSDVYGPFTLDGARDVLRRMKEAPPVSYDVETEDIGYGPGVTEEDHLRAVREMEEEVRARPPLPCGHTQDNWYSICSSHRFGEGGENCGRCQTGRCIACHPDDGKLHFFNKNDGSVANPFPNLHICKAFHTDCGAELLANHFCPKCKLYADMQCVELRDIT